ncbi:hypothetical protein ACFL1Y_01310 [Patescibacteria group bacterium]
MLENIFGSRTRVKLLKLFLTHPNGMFFVRELARKTDEKINSIRRELANLEEVGLIIGEDRIKFDIQKDAKEKRKYYAVNTEFVLYEEFRNLILKSRLLLEKSLAKDIRSIGNIKFLVLSGVFVDDKNCKTDIFIVGKVDKKKLENLIKKIEKDFEQDIRYTLMDEKEFSYRNQVTDKFLFEVLEGKKIVVIDETK